jgi:hypothetical protein
MFVVGGKKKRKGGEREWSENHPLAFLLPECRAHSQGYVKELMI